MVRRILRKAKKIAQRKTRSEQYFFNKKYLGEEPRGNRNLTRIEYAESLSWYSYMCSPDEARDYLAEFLRIMEEPELAEEVLTLSNVWTPCTAAWAARMLTLGCYLPDNEMTFAYICKATAEAIDHDRKSSKLQEERPRVVDRSERIRSDIMTDVDGFIDDYVILENADKFQTKNWLTRKLVSPSHSYMIIERLCQPLAEYANALEGDREGYEHLTNSRLKGKINTLASIVDDIEEHFNSIKKIRKATAPKPPSIEKKLKLFRYQSKDDTLKITSISPSNIIGAQELYVIDTRYKLLTRLVASDESGLDIHRSAIINFSKESKTYRMGRRATELCNKVSNSGKLARRSLLSALTAISKIQNRSSDHLVLVAVST